MEVAYTVKNYAGVPGQERTVLMDFDQVRKNLVSAGYARNIDKLADAVRHGFVVLVDEFQIEIRLAK